MYQWAQHRHVEIDLAPLRLVGSHNLSDFSLCLTLLVSAAYAALVLNFRRHKINDYRGRYRLWYYVCGALFLAASVIGANLTRTLTSSLHWLSTLAGLELDASWGLAAMLVVSLAVGGRLLVEMRASRGAIACLVGAGSLGLAWLVTESQWFGTHGEEFRQMLGSLTRLATSQLLLLSLVVYARHVFLDAQGLISRRDRKSGRRPRLRLRLWRRDKETVTTDAGTPSQDTAQLRAAARRRKQSRKRRRDARAPRWSIPLQLRRLAAEDDRGTKRTTGPTIRPRPSR